MNQDPTQACASATDAHGAYVTTLFNRHRAALQRYLARLVAPDDAAELVQETYYRLLRRGEMIRIDAMAWSFLFQTATNLARDHHRRRASHRAALHVPIEDEEIIQEHLGPDEQIAAEQTRALLERAIAGLLPDARNVFMLRGPGELSVAETAEITGLSERTVARRMAEAVKQLRAAVTGPNG